MAWNPLYVLYAKANGRTPEEQAEADPIEWPGGCMCGFILWVNRKYRELWDVLGVPLHDPSPLQTPRQVLAALMFPDLSSRFMAWLPKNLTVPLRG